MKKWTQWFNTPTERRAYIKAQRQKAEAEGKTLRVLKRHSHCKQRYPRIVMYYADFALE